MAGAHEESAQIQNKDHRQKFSAPVIPSTCMCIVLINGVAAAVGCCAGASPAAGTCTTLVHTNGWGGCLFEKEFGTGFELIFETSHKASFSPGREELLC
jgi:hypothetical protein